MDHSAKLVIIWLTKAEQADPALRASVRAQYADYHIKRYRIVEFLSGTRDLYAQTEGLLLRNRMAAASRVPARLG